MDFGEILSKAWKIIWKFKVLWIFGLLASCGQSIGNFGSGANSNFNMGSHDNPQYYPFEHLPPQVQEFGHTLQNAVNDGSIWVYVLFIFLAVFCLGLIFSLIAMAIGSAGRIGVIKGAEQADQGAEKLTFSQLWSGMKPYFKRVFIFTFLISVAAIVVGLILAVPIIFLAIGTLGCGLILLVPLMIIAGWLVSVWQDQTIVAIVTEDLQIMDAAKRSWELIKANFWRYLGMSAILYIGGIVISLIIALPLIITIFPGMIAMIYGVSEGNNAFIGGGAILLLCFCLLMIPISMILNGIIYSFIGSAWTLTFRRLTGKLPARDDNAIVPVPVNDREIEIKPEE